MNIYDNEYVMTVFLGKDCFSLFLLKTPTTYKGNVSGETTPEELNSNLRIWWRPPNQQS